MILAKIPSSVVSTSIVALSVSYRIENKRYGQYGMHETVFQTDCLKKERGGYFGGGELVDLPPKVDASR